MRLNIIRCCRIGSGDLVYLATLSESKKSASGHIRLTVLVKVLNISWASVVGGIINLQEKHNIIQMREVILFRTIVYGF